jgi:hypothetical protein
MLVHLRKLSVAHNEIGKPDGVLPSRKPAGNRPREGACKATRLPGRHLERPQGDDCVGYSRHLRGSRGTIGSGQLIAKLPA